MSLVWHLMFVGPLQLACLPPFSAAFAFLCRWHSSWWTAASRFSLGNGQEGLKDLEILCWLHIQFASKMAGIWGGILVRSWKWPDRNFCIQARGKIGLGCTICQDCVPLCDDASTLYNHFWGLCIFVGHLLSSCTAQRQFLMRCPSDTMSCFTTHKTSVKSFDKIRSEGSAACELWNWLQLCDRIAAGQSLGSAWVSTLWMEWLVVPMLPYISQGIKSYLWEVHPGRITPSQKRLCQDYLLSTAIPQSLYLLKNMILNMKFQLEPNHEPSGRAGDAKTACHVYACLCLIHVGRYDMHRCLSWHNLSISRIAQWLCYGRELIRARAIC